MRRLRVDMIVVIGLALFAAGFLLGRVGVGGDASGPTEHESHTEAADQTWTCSMHPQVQMPEFGKCPICHIDLIPLDGGGADAGEDALDGGGAHAGSSIELSESALALAEVRTARVERRYPTMQLRLVGKVAIDETRRRSITAYTSGRLDRLYVDTVGTPIRKNDHLVWIYSPELVSAQQEYLQAKRAVLRAGDGLLAESSRRTVESAREKLRLLGLTETQLDELDAKGEVGDHITIYAPMDGVVLERRAVQGSYVSTGEVIYEIADLSQVWVLLEAYESDLPWLRYGQHVDFELAAHPGRSFEGRVSFVDPILDPVTRTVGVRVAVPNEDGLLKPGLFVRATMSALIGEGGRVMDQDLVGKWISPMHPEVIKDGPGSCDVCGMDLVPIAEMGYVPGDADAPLVIPASAPLLTGERAVVYVRRPGDKPVFEMREVELGPRAGAYYLVSSGLHEGEELVVNGAFKLDSAVQISGQRSMMSESAAGGSSSMHDHGESGGGH